MRKYRLLFTIALLCAAVLLTAFPAPAAAESPKYAYETYGLPPTSIKASEDIHEVVRVFMQKLGVEATFLAMDGDAYYLYDLGEGQVLCVSTYVSGEAGDIWLSWNLQNASDPLMSRWLDNLLNGIVGYSHAVEHDWKKEPPLTIGLGGGLEYLDEQMARVLLSQLARGSDEDSDYLRAAMISQYLGAKDPVPPGWRSGQEWFAAFDKPLEMLSPPTVTEDAFISADPFEALVIATVSAALDQQKEEGWANITHDRTLIAPILFETLETGESLTVWAAILDGSFRLYETNKLVLTHSDSFLARLVFVRAPGGEWMLSEMERLYDADGIRAACGAVPGLTERMLDHETDLGLEMNRLWSLAGQYLDFFGYDHGWFVDEEGNVVARE